MRLHIILGLLAMAAFLGMLDLCTAKRAPEVPLVRRPGSVTPHPTTAQQGQQGQQSHAHQRATTRGREHPPPAHDASSELARDLERWQARRSAGGHGGGGRVGPPYTINGLVCSTNVVILTDQDVKLGGSGIAGNLYDWIDAADTTYVLQPGIYSWVGGARAFQDAGDLCVIGNSTSNSEVSIYLGPGTAAVPTMFNVIGDTTSPSLGIQNLLAAGGLQGWGFAAVTSVSGRPASAYLENLYVYGFSVGDFGAGLLVDGAMAYLKGVYFYYNVALDRAGAIDFVTSSNGGAPCGGVIQGCSFQRNSAGRGGAINVDAGCSVDVIDSRFNANTAVSSFSTTAQGGAVFLDVGAAINIDGTLCGKDNRAGYRGGFAYVSAGATLTFNSPANQTVASNLPEDVFIAADGTVNTAGFTNPWAPVPGPFTMWGTLQQCSPGFTDGSGTDVCAAGGCSCATWDMDNCACKAAACSAGAKCCNADGSFKPSTTICRPATSACKRTAYCTGASPDCPASANQPDGHACPFVVQPDVRGWSRRSPRHTHDAAVATAAAATGSTETPTTTLAFKASDDTPTARRLQAYDDSGADSSGLAPCRGECVAGKCLLVWPFWQPEGGCCRVLTLSEFLHHSHGQRGEQHRYGGHDDDAPYAHDDSEPHEAPSKVCWQQAQGGEGYEAPYHGGDSSDEERHDSWERG